MAWVNVNFLVYCFLLIIFYFTLTYYTYIPCMVSNMFPLCFSLGCVLLFLSTFSFCFSLLVLFVLGTLELSRFSRLLLYIFPLNILFVFMFCGLRCGIALCCGGFVFLVLLFCVYSVDTPTGFIIVFSDLAFFVVRNPFFNSLVKFLCLFFLMFVAQEL